MGIKLSVFTRIGITMLGKRTASFTGSNGRVSGIFTCLMNINFSLLICFRFPATHISWGGDFLTLPAYKGKRLAIS
jgi:hypothetical protein